MISWNYNKIENVGDVHHAQSGQAVCFFFNSLIMLMHLEVQELGAQLQITSIEPQE